MDFDRVLMGRSKKMFLRLHNTSPVSAKWNFKLPASHDVNKFLISPSSGSLRSDGKVLVCVEFIPTEARKYHLDVVLRVDQNTRSKSLKLMGEGSGALLRFEPGTVDLGTVLPRAPGEERVVTLTSQSDVAVEVYSLDFDTEYLRDEEVLSAVHVYDTDGYYRSVPRLAGLKTTSSSIKPKL